VIRSPLNPQRSGSVTARSQSGVRGQRDAVVVPLIQGEIKVSARPLECISTLLGSCVSVCLFDPETGVGGMNHMLLAGKLLNDPNGIRASTNEIERLINATLKAGAVRTNLHAKLFGGAQITRGLTTVGETNGAFAESYLQREGIEVDASSLGGDKARRVHFWPTTGRVKMKFVEDIVVAPPRIPRSAMKDVGDVELF